MTEDERKTIEYWKEQLKSYKKEIEQRQNDEFKGYGTDEDIAKFNYCNIHIMLNLIEKQQAEIEKLRNNNKDLLRKLRNRVKEVKKLTRYSLYKKEFATLNKQIKHKDNEIKCLKSLHNTQVEIIDEMAKTLKWSFNAGLGLIPSSICDCKGDIRNCEDKICTDCIKEYFKKKVEEK